MTVKLERILAEVERAGLSAINSWYRNFLIKELDDYKEQAETLLASPEIESVSPQYGEELDNKVEAVKGRLLYLLEPTDKKK